jgi:hypothetical protein
MVLRIATAVELSKDIGQMLRWAEKRKPWRGLLIEGNPADLVEIKKLVPIGYTKKRTRHLSISEIVGLKNTLKATDRAYQAATRKYGAERPLKKEVQIALWICLSTLCRIGELLRTEWTHVSFADRTWTIPAENTKGTNVGNALQRAMREIEKTNPDTLYGVFGDAQWTNKDRLSDALLKDLIEHFSRVSFGNKNVTSDLLGDAYEYLIKKFADATNKKAGEFYTGRMAVVLPQGALFRKGAEGSIRQKLLEMDLVEAVIGLAPNLFYGTGLAACILVLRKKKPTQRRKKVMIADASRLFRRGRAQNYLEPDHAIEIQGWFEKYADVQDAVRIVGIDEIKAEDWTLNISRYVLPPLQGGHPAIARGHRRLQGGIDPVPRSRGSAGQSHR